MRRDAGQSGDGDGCVTAQRFNDPIQQPPISFAEPRGLGYGQVTLALPQQGSQRFQFL